ncbi:hypothetical protein EST38_g122 [Candolleomyces aberdarensis]|uniref:RlpA-like protein double-psi beta-barrel domain-containing protein n=1 Tax=Candolleomyces aberdarensis TaxID=2316362 RepID=A0A4Q2E1S8_9AGAR|nr:hypothetical protein EST38_g122 [Candolleomyces aberdarensis]
MNVHDYKYSDCFKTITITYEGRSTQATVGDMCPTCPPGGLDLSMGLFKHVAPRAQHHHHHHQKEDDDYIDSKLYDFNSEPHFLVNAGYLGQRNIDV